MEHTQTTNSYVQNTQKRKRYDVDSILEKNKENISTQVPSCKRHQGLFRPWLDSNQEAESTVSHNKSNDSINAKHNPTPVPLASTYHANMVRQHQVPRQRSPKEQQRRDRNTLACLLSRRARQAQEAQMAVQYEQYRAQQAAILEQQVRFSLYYRQFLQQAVFQSGVNAVGFDLPEQQQQFLQQMALSQQLIIFGSHR